MRHPICSSGSGQYRLFLIRPFSQSGKVESCQRKFAALRCSATVKRDLNGESNSCDIIWFKNDLRLHDHPGLQKAQKSSSIQPVYILDPTQLTQRLREPNGVQGLVGGCKALDQRLRELGSKLLVVHGDAAAAIPALAHALQSRNIITEDEVEYWQRQTLQSVREKLPQGAQMETWSTALFSDGSYGEDFRTFKKQRGPQNETLPEPRQLPPPAVPSKIPTDLKIHTVSLEAFLETLREADAALLAPEVRQAAKGIAEGWGASGASIVQDMAQGGEPQALQTLRRYLGSAASPSGDDSDMSKAIDMTETRATPLGSFPAIFSQAIALGTLSRREVYAQAQRSSAEGTGRGFGNLRTADAAATTAEAADFHWHLARADGLREAQVATVPRHWRWRGFLTDYYTADPEEFGGEAPASNAPAFLLVHGFGAFGSQWRGQLKALASQGCLVYAPTLPGYGRAEKPSLPYSQQLWVEFLRDFVVEVVRRPVLVVGNSIGGFMSASLAADYPGLVQGLVLMNSAGLLVEKYKPPPTESGNTAMNQLMSGPPAFLVDAVTSALLFYLEKTVSRTLKRAYPVNPSMADAWLSTEIARAAGDLGAKQVFRSVFYLPKPRPLNYLVTELFKGPTLLLQGAKDPLQNAPRRAKEMKRLCSNVEVVLVDAGHCPFDESPDFCNKELLRFFKSLPPAKPAPAAVPTAAV